MVRCSSFEKKNLIIESKTRVSGIARNCGLKGRTEIYCRLNLSGEDATPQGFFFGLAAFLFQSPGFCSSGRFRRDAGFFRAVFEDELSLEAFIGELKISPLNAVLRGHRRKSRWLVDEPDGAFHFVSMLTPSAAASERMNLNFLSEGIEVRFESPR